MSVRDLVHSLVPQSRSSTGLESELVSHCNDILGSHIGHGVHSDLGHLADQVKRHLLHTSPSGSASLKFTNLLSRLLNEPALSRKHASILFLHSLASSKSSPSSFLPALAAPPPQRLSPTPRLSSSPSPIDSGAPASNKPKGKSKARLLQEWRARSGQTHLPESLLLRDTLYLLQGISGKHVRFSDNMDAHINFVEDPKYIVSAPTVALIHRLAEVGYLYSRVDGFVRASPTPESPRGMIEQSLCHHLQAQLTEYYRIIAVLETQMNDNSLSSENGVDSALEGATGLTLRRLDVWINDWRLRMRMMSVCVQGAQDAHGGALVNLIHSYTDTGDPFIRKFTDELLEQVSKPFFSTLHKWLFSGELYDPFSEFFVGADPTTAFMHQVHPSALEGFLGGEGDVDQSGDVLTREGGKELWESKYTFEGEMLPAFVGEAFGKKIFSTGKSLNFIRYSCHDSDWVATREKMTDTGGTLKYSDITGLERSIDAAYQVASQRIFEIFLGKFKLLDHLSALKNYLLLGHGDFAEQLMEALGPSLAKTANTLYRHNLTATLETAIRSSNAQSDSPDVLRRLDARMLEYSHGEIGWDVFTLEYKVDAPIDTVLDGESMASYLRLFHFLWRMKRIEGTLNAAWVRVASGVKMFVRMPELDSEWHRIRIHTAEMIHFIRNIQAYCHLEVIECAWKDLMEFLRKREGDLDALIQAHHTFLDRLVKKVFLISSKPGKEENAMNQIKDIFAIILDFREATDNLYNYCLTESARRDTELDVQRGIHVPAGPRIESSPERLALLMQNVKNYAQRFSDRTLHLVQQLQVHSDLDCRFLAVRLSFSEYYRSKK